MNKTKRKHKCKPKCQPTRESRLVCPPELQQLRNRCLAPIERFFSVGEVTHTRDGPLIFQDNGSDVLAVAHLDTVRQDRHFGVYREDRDTLFNCQLDDRLGAWIILDALPARDIVPDVLLTTGEESCRSTAAYFANRKQYNWIVEFDRMGTDVVTYQYTSCDWLDALHAAGNRIGYGSYSDIAELDHLETAAVNWGVGYHNNHAPDSYCSISELGDALERFVKFYKENYAIRYNHVQVDEWWNQYVEEDHAYDCQCPDCENKYGWYESTEEGKLEQEEWNAYYATQNRGR